MRYAPSQPPSPSLASTQPTIHHVSGQSIQFRVCQHPPPHVQCPLPHDSTWCVPTQHTHHPPPHVLHPPCRQPEQPALDCPAPTTPPPRPPPQVLTQHVPHPRCHQRSMCPTHHVGSQGIQLGVGQHPSQRVPQRFWQLYTCCCCPLRPWHWPLCRRWPHQRRPAGWVGWGVGGGEGRGDMMLAARALEASRHTVQKLSKGLSCSELLPGAKRGCACKVAQLLPAEGGPCAAGPWQQLRALRGHGCAHAPTKTLASHAAHLGGSVGSVPSLSVLTSMGVGAAAAAAASAAAASAAAAAAAVDAALGCLLAAAGRCLGAGPRLTGFFRRRALWRSSCRDENWSGSSRGAYGTETRRGAPAQTMCTSAGEVGHRPKRLAIGGCNGSAGNLACEQGRDAYVSLATCEAT